MRKQPNAILDIPATLSIYRMWRTKNVQVDTYSTYVILYLGINKLLIFVRTVTIFILTFQDSY